MLTARKQEVSGFCRSLFIESHFNGDSLGKDEFAGRVAIAVAGTAHGDGADGAIRIGVHVQTHPNAAQERFADRLAVLHAIGVDRNRSDGADGNASATWPQLLQRNHKLRRRGRWFGRGRRRKLRGQFGICAQGKRAGALPLQTEAAPVPLAKP